MQRTYAVIFLFVVGIVAINQSCNKIARVSRQGTAKSHLGGTSCMSCHNEKALNKQIYTVAGSILNEARNSIQPRAIIKLYSESKGKGKLVAVIPTDDHGNFYITKNIDFSKGLYPTLLGTPGVKEDTKHMGKAIYTGDCSSCHGPTAELLGID